MTSALRLAGVWLALFLGAAPALSQEPKVGQVYYEDNIELGFKIKVPKDWDFIPSQPLEQNIIGKYAPPNSTYISLGGTAYLALNTWLVRFDRRGVSGTDAVIEKDEDDDEDKGPARDLDEWMEERLDEGTGWRYDASKYPKKLKGSKVPGETFLYTGMSTLGPQGNEPKPIHCYAALFTLAEDLEVALVGVGPSNKKWRTYEKAYNSMAKSMKRVEVEVSTTSAAAALGMSPRAQKRIRLEAEVAKSSGWELHETQNYFIISSNTDKQFLDELKERLEGIRAVYEGDYPPDKARKIVVKPKEEDEEDEDTEIKAAPGEEKEDEEEEAEEDTTEVDRSFSAIDPMEASRLSVVRVCKDSTEYHQYGGPPRTGGYWHSAAEELVIFDDRAGRGRDFTWGVMNHEAFHQYIFYFYGELSPHSWYNEGNGDYYFGYEYKRKKYTQDKARNRLLAVQDLIRREKHVPLQEFVHWSKEEYYGQNDRGLDPGYAYAQGWSLIWFLRTAEKNRARGWDDSWDGILAAYLDHYLDTGDRKAAVDKAFEGVDWEDFEKAWRRYIKP